MTPLLVTSGVVLASALIWSLRSTWREQDRRFLLLPAGMAVIIGLQIVVFVEELGSQNEDTLHQLLMLLLAALALLNAVTVIFIQRLLVRGRKTTAALDQSERMFQSLAAVAPVGIFRTDPRGDCVYVNEEWCRIAGLSRSEAMGEGWARAIHPEDRERVYTAWMQAVAADGRLDLEFRFQRPDGVAHWVFGRAAPDRDSNGRLYGYVGTLTDITARRAAERALADTEQRLYTVVNNAPIVLFAIDASGNFTLSEGSGLTALGLTPGAVVGRNVFDLYGTDTEVSRHVRAALAGSSFTAVTTAGAHTYETHFSALRGPSGEVVSVTGVATDITSRVRAEKELRFRIAFEQLLASISAQFISRPLDRIDADINDALRLIGEFCGVDRAYLFQSDERLERSTNTHEWCAPGVSAHIHEFQDVPNAAFPWLFERLAHLETVHIPRVADLPDAAGNERAEMLRQQVRSSVMVPLVLNGRLMGLLGMDSVKGEKAWPPEIIRLLQRAAEIFVNALDRQRAERKRRDLEGRLLETQKLESLGVMAGGIAHDFNNLLATIIANTSVARMTPAGANGSGEYLDAIETTARRAAELCRQLLAYAGKGHVQVTWVDLNAVAEELARLLRVSLGERTTIRLSLDPTLPHIHADATQVRQVLMNLVLNAAEALSDKGGTIVVTTSAVQADHRYLAEFHLAPRIAEGRYAQLEVSDDGCGMDSATLARIFDPFFTTKFTGRGLGLPAVLGIVRSHGGAIHVRSSPGAGSTFRVLLPFDNVAAASPNSVA